MKHVAASVRFLVRQPMRGRRKEVGVACTCSAQSIGFQVPDHTLVEWSLNNFCLGAEDFEPKRSRPHRRAYDLHRLVLSRPTFSVSLRLCSLPNGRFPRQTHKVFSRTWPATLTINERALPSILLAGTHIMISILGSDIIKGWNKGVRGKWMKVSLWSHTS